MPDPTKIPRKREKSSAKFYQPPPVIILEDGWSHGVSIPIDEAIDLHTQLGKAIEEAAKMDHTIEQHNAVNKR